MLSLAQKQQIISLSQTAIPANTIAKLLGVDNHTIYRLLKTRKRILVISDLHCGHQAGLTPPPWWREADKFYEQNIEIWEWYTRK